MMELKISVMCLKGSEGAEEGEEKKGRIIIPIRISENRISYSSGALCVSYANCTVS